ncbi:hypothetical protein S83_065980, partial [Arachis hypogaea]
NSLLQMPNKGNSNSVQENESRKERYLEQMGFGGLANVPEMNVSNTLLVELLDRFDIERGCLKTLQGTINITPRKVVAALDINNG